MPPMELMLMISDHPDAFRGIIRFFTACPVNGIALFRQ